MSSPTPPSVSWRDLSAALAALIAKETAPALRDAFAKADDMFFNLSERGNNASDYMEALRQLRQTKTALLAGWDQHVLATTVAWGQPSVSSLGLELSLVSNDELEGKLAVDQMGEAFLKAHGGSFKHLNNLWPQLLAHVWQQQGRTTTAAALATDSLGAPLHQQGLANMVSAWVDGTELALQPRVVLLKLIEREMTKPLGSLLPKAIDLFNRAGWHVRSTDAQDAPAPEAPKPEEPTSWALDQVDTLDTLPTFDVGELDSEPLSSLPPPPPSVARDRPLDSASARALASALQQLLGQPMGQPPLDHMAQDMPLDHWDPTLADLVQLLHARRVQHHEQAQAGMRMGMPMPVKTVKNVLSHLQTNLPDTVRQAARQNDKSLSHQFKTEMINQAKQMGVGEDARLGDQEEDAVDIVGMLFEVFLSERQMSEDMREHISRLLAPYVKVAMNDRKMFMHRFHPARKFLDVIAEACEGNMGTSTHEKNTLDKVTASIDRLSAEFNEDVAIFDLIETEVRSFVDQQKATIELAEKRAAEAQKGKERLERARARAEEAFAQSMQGINWPIRTVDMLKGYWCQHHMMVVLRNEDNDKAVRHSEEFLQRLIAVGCQGVSHMAGAAPALHAEMLIMLAASGLTDVAGQEAAMDLWSALDQASQWTKLADKGTAQEMLATAVAKVAPIQAPDMAEVLASTQWAPEAEKAPTIRLVSEKEVPEDEDLVNYFRTMDVNTWVDFVKEDGSLISTRLSWVSPISQRLLFVNKRGMKHAVESPEDLAIMVKRGTLRLREVGLGTSGFNHSYHKAISALGASVRPVGG